MKSSLLFIPTLALFCVASGELMPMLAAGLAEMDGAVLLRQVGVGFQHILPDGLDHVAFLLGLFFLSRSFPALVGQVTVFTLAHSLTLGLVYLSGVVVPPSWVEVAVGLSIALLAVEGVLSRGRGAMPAWRWALLVVFGGIHGLAFAHSLVTNPDLARSPAAALLGFNLGVELGQLVVTGLLFMLAAPWWRAAWYQARVARPALALLTLAGLAWTISRAC